MVREKTHESKQLDSFYFFADLFKLDTEKFRLNQEVIRHHDINSNETPRTGDTFHDTCTLIHNDVKSPLQMKSEPQ